MEVFKIKELLLKIMNAAFEKTACSDYNVVINFSGNVMSLTVTVYLGKERMFDKYLYLLLHFENYKTDVPTL